MVEVLYVVNEVEGLKGFMFWILIRIYKLFFYVKNYKDSIEDFKDVRGDLENKICEV